jgi:hypothetical protein
MSQERIEAIKKSVNKHKLSALMNSDHERELVMNDIATYRGIGPEINVYSNTTIEDGSACLMAYLQRGNFDNQTSLLFGDLELRRPFQSQHWEARSYFMKSWVTIDLKNFINLLDRAF